MTCPSHLLDDLRTAREELLAACADASDEAIRRRPAASHPEPVEGWAPIEVLAHIADVDRYYLSEARAIRDEPGRMFVYFDDETWKRGNADAIDREPRDVRLAMAFAHDEVVRWARSLTPEELDIAGGHPRRVSITVREVLERIPNHDRNHAAQIKAALNSK
jgi:uncharacterized damage-inducible protein DinB